MDQILLIEDDDNDFELFRRYLTSFDQSTRLVRAKSLSESKDALESNFYKMIFIDLGLPDSSGPNSIEKIKVQSKGTPIIILTGNEDEDLLGHASHNDIYDYILKSDLNKRLLKRVIKYTTSRFKERAKQQNSERLLRKSQRIEAIGRLTGGIAHDFNNKLQILSCSLKLLEKKVSIDPKSKEYIKMMNAAIQSSSNLTQRLTAFSRSQELEKSNKDIKLIINNSLNMLEIVIRSNVNLNTEIAKDKFYSFVDEIQVDQLIMNLVLNAQDAIGHNYGEIKISVTTSGPEESFSTDKNRDEKFIKITVRDSGCGMDEETKLKAVEPYFSTKGLPEGTGLGLSVVDGIVEQHRGFLTFEDNKPNGLCVNIYLPQVDGSTEEASAKSVSKVIKPSEELIVLFAEDEPALRKVTTSLMELEGIKVIEAENGIDALEKFKENRSKVDVILTDMVMPKMSGKELFTKIRELEPDMGVIFLSGYSQKELTSEKGRLEENCRLLKKPVELEDLLDSLYETSSYYQKKKKK
jgi:signal transduction histidine kinase